MDLLGLIVPRAMEVPVLLMLLVAENERLLDEPSIGTGLFIKN
jgi:hypothetical protein